VVDSRPAKETPWDAAPLPRSGLLEQSAAGMRVRHAFSRIKVLRAGPAPLTLVELRSNALRSRVRWL
jgi:hypothetical protein